MSDIDQQLLKLSARFPAGDIEWRVMRALAWGQNIRCVVYPYVTARAIHQRLDDVVGPANWCNTPQHVSSVLQLKDNRAVLSVQVGISIRIGSEWLTKYNVSEATDVEAAKGAFSGAEKRAGEEWGIGRYLWFLGEMDAETTKTDPGRNSNWTYGKLPEGKGGDKFWWQPPQLPAWALPPAPDANADDKPVTELQLNALKSYWANKMAPNEKNRATKAKRFTDLVVSMFGGFPVDQPAGWTNLMIEQVRNRIDATKDGNGPSGDVPFE